ncbi:MAG: hypothetical protein Q8N18_25625 [Opitutaceae bacterium]|nr:hypothetical protein [Opitutaceae bacterium]
MISIIQRTKAGRADLVEDFEPLMDFTKGEIEHQKLRLIAFASRPGFANRRQASPRLAGSLFCRGGDEPKLLSQDFTLGEIH